MKCKGLKKMQKANKKLNKWLSKDLPKLGSEAKKKKYKL